MSRFARIRRVYAQAVERAPALAARFAAAGLTPDDLTDADALTRLPVLKKERLLELQAAEPPFAGFLACDPVELGHIYVSPGPIFEPSLADDGTGHGMNMMFQSAGVGPGDVALNTWSYHLVPAGLLFDKGLQAVGATVVPSGTGNTELQASLLLTLRPNVFLGSTAYFQTLCDHLRAAGHRLPDAWALKHAFLGGEFGDWSAKRARIEAELGLKTWSCYATADFGLIGYETPGEAGYAIHADRYVQICDPHTGAPLPEGQPGEIVVTTLARGWPMIRFGTGDAARALATAQDGGVARIGPLEGRVGAAVKAREIFVYPAHVEALAKRVEGILEARAAVERIDGRESILLELLAGAGHIPQALEPAVTDAFRQLTRLKADRLRWVGGTQDFTIDASLVDRKDV
ncbi:phenylacetate--CoA ligase family protein [Polymorphum gilvum]|uniref:AMP-binding enzyme n=1 Tax=Polymorphum gilvum (strain LMG 25793 / CGMCC 1.9160 / SL003B-26A1) TaxID=991905 RepID=F2IYQ5_POLGS|nr:phenylacetate--CoA ligase family protein [Polymorphum gilvum]ADZ69502.1 AMP-binding enzyme [Polymorphum gilvum SL003B-26A1]